MRIYTDGACRKGIGGWGWWNPETKEYRSGHEEPSTNQRMELKAALEAISEYFYHDVPEIVIVSDSAYLVNCFGEKWFVKWLANGWIGSKHREVANRDLWEPLLEMVEEHDNIKFVWVKGHSGDPGNEKADSLATGEVIKLQKEKSDGEATDIRREAEAKQGREGRGVHSRSGEAPGLSFDGLAEADFAGDPPSQPGG